MALEKEGIEWIDSTITGMGRGPGNTKSEDIVKSFKQNFEYSNFKNFKNYINKNFIPLKKNTNGELIITTKQLQNLKFILLMFKRC